MTAQERVTIWAQTWNARLLRFLVQRGATLQESEDFTQEIYLRLLRIGDLDLVQNPQAYLFKVAANLLAEWRGRASQARPHESELLETLTASGSIEDDLQNQEEHDILRQALTAMRPATRRVLLLHIREELTYEEIAGRLGYTRRMVKRHVLEGYAELRQRLAGLRCEQHPKRITR